MPTLIGKHRKTVAETGLKKFYTTMNQAIQLSVSDNGETKYWNFATNNTSAEIEVFYNKYFKTLKTEIRSMPIESGVGNYFTIFFADGSGSAIDFKGHNWYYCTNAKDLSQFVDKNGTGCFLFGFYPTEHTNNAAYVHKVSYNKGIEPYVQAANLQVGTDESGNPIYEAPSENNLYKGGFWARAIQINGWEIPDDYPLNF